MSDLDDFTDFDPDDADEDDADSGAGPETVDATTDGATGETGEGDGGDRDDTGGFESVDVAPRGADSGIGVVSATEGLRISEDGDETELRAYVTVRNRSAVRIGKYLLVPYPDGERLFCRITALEYAQEFRADDATEIHARRAMRQKGIDEQDFKFVATLEPVAVLYTDGGELKRRMTDRVPKPETPVREATDTGEI
ncbi:AAA family ATPase, partial [Halobacteriales archaeon QH_6_68_27]